MPYSSAQCFEFKNQSLSFFSSGPSNLLLLLYFLFFIHSTCYHLTCYIIYFFMMMIIYLPVNTTEQKSLSLVLTGVCQPPEPCHIVGGGVNKNLLNKWKHSNYSSTSSFVPRMQISFLSYDKGTEQLRMFALEGSAAGEKLESSNPDPRGQRCPFLQQSGPCHTPQAHLPALNPRASNSSRAPASAFTLLKPPQNSTVRVLCFDFLILARRKSL